MNAPSQRASDPISSTTIPVADTPRLPGLNVASYAAFVGFGSYFFAANTGRWGSRFAFSLAGGVVCGLVTRATVRLLPLAWAGLRQSLTDHRSTLMHRALWGAVIGVVAGCFFWDFSDGVLPGLQVAGLLGAIGGAMAVLSFAPQERRAVNRQSWADISPPLLTAFFLTLVLVNAPRIHVTVENDGSWTAVLNYAHLKEWRFGNDIVFTYGPLGFLTTPWFSSHWEWLRLTTNVALTFCVVSGLCLLVWRVPRTWRYLVLATFVLTSPGIHHNPAPHAGVDLLVPEAFFCWGLLCLLEPRPRLWAGAFVFTSLAVFGALSKTTLLALSCVSVVAVAGCLCLRRERQAGVTIIISFVAGCLCLWLALGQRFSNLTEFLAGALAVAAPYDQTMCFPTPIGAQGWGVITAALSLVAALLTSSSTFRSAGNSQGFRWLATAWLAGLTFIAWKNGFARGDSFHVEMFVGFAVLLGLVMSALGAEAPAQTTWARSLAIVACLAGINTLKQSFYPGYLGSALEHPLSLLTENAGVLSRPTQYWQLMGRAGEPLRRAAQLTKLKPLLASVDVFGNQQALALFNNLNYRPRPVFASYAAYSLPLMQLNERFYSSSNAPEFVLFKLDALSQRFPPLEDALLLRDLLINYRPVGNERGFLLLKAARTGRPGLTLLHEGTITAGAQIPLSEYAAADLWVEIEIKPTLAGQIRRLLYNGSGVTIRVWPSGPERPSPTFAAPAPMLAAGFIASPLLLNTKDVLDLYGGARIVRPSAYSVELTPGAERWWQKTVNYRVYRIDDRLG